MNSSRHTVARTVTGGSSVFRTVAGASEKSSDNFERCPSRSRKAHTVVFCDSAEHCPITLSGPSKRSQANAPLRRARARRSTGNSRKERTETSTRVVELAVAPDRAHPAWSFSPRPSRAAGEPGRSTTTLAVIQSQSVSVSKEKSAGVANRSFRENRLCPCADAREAVESIGVALA